MTQQSHSQAYTLRKQKLKKIHVPQCSLQHYLQQLEYGVKVTQSCLTLCKPMNYTIHGIFQARYWSGQPFPSPGDLPNRGIKPRTPALRANSLPSEPPGKPKNTGLGSLSVLQGKFLTQESNQDLLHCRWILYHLSYEGSPTKGIKFIIASVKIFMKMF